MADQARQTLGLPNQQHGQKQPPQQAQKSGAKVTYVPGDEGPNVTKFRGFEFKSHVPTMVSQELADAIDGNPYFKVGDFDPASLGPKPTDLPKDHIQYRAYVVRWLKSVRTTEELVKHWADDRNLRQACDVGSDDIGYLGTLLDPKLTELARADGLNNQQVADIWIKHGILDLPWRS